MTTPRKIVPRAAWRCYSSYSLWECTPEGRRRGPPMRVKFSTQQTARFSAGDVLTARLRKHPTYNSYDCLKIVACAEGKAAGPPSRAEQLKGIAGGLRFPTGVAGEWSSAVEQDVPSVLENWMRDVNKRTKKGKHLKKPWLKTTGFVEGEPTTRVLLTVGQALRVLVDSAVLCEWMGTHGTEVLKIIREWFHPSRGETYSPGAGARIGAAIAANPFLVWCRLGTARMRTELSDFDRRAREIPGSEAHRDRAMRYLLSRENTERRASTYSKSPDGGTVPGQVVHVDCPWAEFVEDGDFGCLYPGRLYFHERCIAEVFSELASSSREVRENLDARSSLLIVGYTGKAAIRCKESIENYLHRPLQLDPDQSAAMRGALASGVSFIDGAAGCGKTTTLGALVSALMHRAMREGHKRPRTEIETFTMHKIFHGKPGKLPMDSGATAGRLVNSLIGRVTVIIDEASMVDCATMGKFLAHVRGAAHIVRLVLVGDLEQLPPIGCGGVLHDVVRSRRVPVFRLHKVHRQAGANNGILINAHAVRKMSGNGPVSGVLASGGNFAFDALPSGSGIPALVEAVRARLTTDLVGASAAAAGAETTRQVIAPTNRICDALSPMIREIYIPNWRDASIPTPVPVSASSRRERWRYCLRDRVMSCGNIYVEDDVVMESVGGGEAKTIKRRRLAVANGSMGRVTQVDDAGVVVHFETEDETLTYDHRLTKKAGKEGASLDGARPSENGGRTQPFHLLQPAWCVTVHKFQGSEFPDMVFALGEQLGPFLSRNMLYTGVTRSKTSLALVATEEVVNACHDRVVPGPMHLAERLCAGAPPRNVVRLSELTK